MQLPARSSPSKSGVGLQSITDGEFRREDFYTDFFVRGLGGVEVRMESTAAYFVDHEGRKIPVPWAQVVSRDAMECADLRRSLPISSVRHQTNTKSDPTLPNHPAFHIRERCHT